MSQQSLGDIQLALQNYLLNKQRDVENLTLETPQFSREERLFIYHNAYRLRLVDALRNDYPALEKQLGEENFTQLCGEYIAQYPSQHPSLRWLGKHLADFLQANEHWNKSIHLGELAKFEWAQIMAFDAADETVATLDDVRTLAPEAWMTMQLQYHSSVRLLDLYSNVPALWYGLINEDVEVKTEIVKESQTWLVWREDLRVVYRPLEKPEAWALEAFINSKKFSDVCEGLCEWFEEEEVPMKAAQYLQHWILGGLITKIITSA